MNNLSITRNAEKKKKSRFWQCVLVNAGKWHCGGKHESPHLLQPVQGVVKLPPPFQGKKPDLLPLAHQ